jgi:hypothetical protein
MFSNTIKPITKERIDELLQFLPLFDKPGRQFVQRWEDADDEPGDAIAEPFPVYFPEVKKFFQLANRPCWFDNNYEPDEAEIMLKNSDLVASASLDQIKTMLTHCVMGERYYEGHWEEVLQSGQLVALLKRLQVLRSSM